MPSRQEGSAKIRQALRFAGARGSLQSATTTMPSGAMPASRRRETVRRTGPSAGLRPPATTRQLSDCRAQAATSAVSATGGSSRRTASQCAQPWRIAGAAVLLGGNLRGEGQSAEERRRAGTRLGAGVGLEDDDLDGAVAAVGGGDDAQREGLGVGHVGGGNEDDEPRRRAAAAEHDRELDPLLGGQRADVAVDEPAGRAIAGAAVDRAEDGQAGRLLERAEGLEASGERVAGEDRGGEAGEAEDAGQSGEKPPARAGGDLGRDGGVEDAGAGLHRLLLGGDLVEAGEQDDVELLARRRLALDVGDGDLCLLERERVGLEGARLALERLDPLGLEAAVEVEAVGLLGDEADGEGAERRGLCLELGDDRAVAARGAGGGKTLLHLGKLATGGDDLGRVDELARGLRPKSLGGGVEFAEAGLGVGALGAGEGEGAADGAELVLGGRRVRRAGAEEGAALGLGPAVERGDPAAEVADLAVHPQRASGRRPGACGCPGGRRVRRRRHSRSPPRSGGRPRWRRPR